MEDNQQQPPPQPSDEKLFEHPTFVASNVDEDNDNNQKKQEPVNVVGENRTFYELNSNFSLIKTGSQEQQQQQPQQIKTNEKLFEHPTLFEDSAMIDGTFELDSNFSILKPEKPTTLSSEQPLLPKVPEDNNLDPDDFIIERTENSANFVDLDFTINNSVEKSVDDKKNIVGKENLKDKESTIEPVISLTEEIGNKNGAGADDSLITTDSVGDICDEKFDLLEISTCENISEEMDSSMDNGSKIVSDVGGGAGDILDKTPINEEMDQSRSMPFTTAMKVINDNSGDSEKMTRVGEDIADKLSDQFSGLKTEFPNEPPKPEQKPLDTFEQITSFTDPEPIMMMNESENSSERKKRSIEDYGFVGEESTTTTIPEFVDQQSDQPLPTSHPTLVDSEKISPVKIVSENDVENQQRQSGENSIPSSMVTDSSQVHDSPAAAAAAIAATLLHDDDKIINDQPTPIPMTNENATSTFASGGGAKPSPFDVDDDQQQRQQTLEKKKEEVVVASAAAAANKIEEKKSIEGAAAAAIVTKLDELLDDDFLPTSASTKEQILSSFLATTAEAEQKKKEDDDVDHHHQQRPTTNENIIIEEPTQQQRQQQQLQPEREKEEDNFADIKDKEQQQVPVEKQHQHQQQQRHQKRPPPPPPPPEVVDTSLTSAAEPLLSSSSSSSNIEGHHQFDSKGIKTEEQQQPEPSAPTLIHSVEQPKQEKQQQPSSSSSIEPTKTMGKKSRYNQGDNSSGSSGSASLEPDCVHQFIATLFGQCVADILYWRDPKNSGVVFGAGLVILFSLTIFSVISVVAYTLLFTLLGTLSFRVYKNVMQAVNKTEDGHPFKEYLEVEITPSRERAHEIADQLLSNFNCFITRMRSVLLVEDYVESFKYLFFFWALTFIGSWFNGMTLVILAYIGAFSVPKLYEMNQAQIDQYINLVTTKINEITEKIPFLKKAGSSSSSSDKKDD